MSSGDRQCVQCRQADSIVPHNRLLLPSLRPTLPNPDADLISCRPHAVPSTPIRLSTIPSLPSTPPPPPTPRDASYDDDRDDTPAFHPRRRTQIPGDGDACDDDGPCESTIPPSRLQTGSPRSERACGDGGRRDDRVWEWGRAPSRRQSGSVDENDACEERLRPSPPPTHSHDSHDDLVVARSDGGACDETRCPPPPRPTRSNRSRARGVDGRDCDDHGATWDALQNGGVRGGVANRAFRARARRCWRRFLHLRPLAAPLQLERRATQAHPKARRRLRRRWRPIRTRTTSCRSRRSCDVCGPNDDGGSDDVEVPCSIQIRASCLASFVVKIEGEGRE